MEGMQTCRKVTSGDTRPTAATLCQEGTSIALSLHGFVFSDLHVREARRPQLIERVNACKRGHAVDGTTTLRKFSMNSLLCRWLEMNF
jgi:hypothetical protein